MNSRNNDSPYNITFDSLPQAIGIILNKLEQLESILAAKGPELALKPPVDTQHLCNFLNVTEPTVARYRKQGIIPFYTIGSAIRYDLGKVVASLENKKRSK